jgi:asparagine synthase (glutamine-hydrolysing)
MGHLLLEVNPEDAFENQPVQERAVRWSARPAWTTGPRCWRLSRSLASEASRFSDGHLVSLAFDRWGEELCSHLQGDWALAAWDAREHRLLLARDACGNANLYYYEGKGFVAFASSLKALLALPGVVKEPDRLRLAQVLVSWQHDAELTAYKGFRRLVWAHAMTVGPDGHTRTWRHWSPEGRSAHLSTGRGVRRGISGILHTGGSELPADPKPVAATLSGGRDSGSVVAMAAPLLARQGRGLTAYTSVPCLPADGAGDRRMGNEWEMAHSTAVMAGANVQHIPIDAANYGVIQGIEYVLDAMMVQVMRQATTTGFRLSRKPLPGAGPGWY